jgi:hypothetical protein
MGLVEFIQDHRWWVLAICFPLIVIYGRVLLLAALGSSAPPARPTTAPVRRVPPKPAQPGGMVKPSGMTPPPEGRQEVLPNSLDAGLTGHQKAGAAKTVKLPAAPIKPTDSPATRKPGTEPPKPADSEADAMEGLFGKRDDAVVPPSESPSQALRRKASRMEELGFHHGIAAELLSKGDAKPAAPAATPAATPATPAAPAANPADTSVIPGGNAVPRSSTAELTSILERIDKFLAEDTPATPSPTQPGKPATTTISKPAAPAGAALEPAKPASDAQPQKATEAMPKAESKPDPNKKTQPMWARADAQDEDIDEPPKKDTKPGEGDQQRLF